MAEEATHQVLIGGRWRPAHNPCDFFRAVDPSTGTQIGGLYPVSDRSETG
jgi:hypothetical protein